MAPRTHQRTRPDPWGKCFPSRSQGLTFTRELQPNGLHPPRKATTAHGIPWDKDRLVSKRDRRRCRTATNCIPMGRRNLARSQRLSGKLFHTGQELTPTAVAPEESVSPNNRTDTDSAVAISP